VREQEVRQRPGVAAQAFYNRINDLAVFGEPDSQVLGREADAYRTLTENATPFTIGRLRFHRLRRRSQDGTVISLPRRAVSAALMLSLDGEWFKCRITSRGRVLWIEDAAQPVQPGMSGSPIILPDGSAVGVVCVGTDEGLEGGPAPLSFDGPDPLLFDCLPAWLVREAL
jgi:hypothetical protein